MIFLYFEDWSQFTFMLDGKGIEHGGRVIKVYASPNDPREQLGDRNIKVIEVDDSPLNNIAFSYEKRGWVFGEEIEKNINPLSEFGKRTVRGLLRFSNREDLQFCQTGMKMKKSEGWLIDHPLEDIDGIEMSLQFPETRGATIHLDIFNKESLEKLAAIIDISPNSKELVDVRMGKELKREIQAEISTRKVERK